MRPSPGVRLGPYEILAPIGAGGMGEVYRARDHRLGRDVAIKVIAEARAGDAAALARFEREAKAVAALSHPNVLAIHDVGSEQGLSYAVMELLEGETLRDRLRSPLPWRKAIELAVAIAEGLSAAHAKGITHRDLKPENVFLTSDGRLKILDFGLARLKPAIAAGELSSSPTASRSGLGQVVGTLGYMSPEQVQGQPVDHRSDIFSLGAVLYELIAGERAFRAGSAVDTMNAILAGDPPQEPLAGRGAPSSLQQVIRRCLEKDPAQRFQSARDLAYALQALATDTAAVPGGGPAALRRYPAARWAAVAVLVPLLALALSRVLDRGGAIDSLAVLPFTNAGGNPDTEYLSEGIAGSLIDSLSQIPGLRVTARSLAFRHGGPEMDPQKAGRALKVRALVTGAVLQRGDTLSVRVELMDVAAGSQLWGQQYNRKLADVLGIQEDISREVTDNLRLKLTGEDRRRLGRRPTVNAEAYQAYLKGRHHMLKLTQDGVALGIQSLNQAISIDPGYAAAHAALAEAHLFQTFFSPPAEVYARARAAALRAIELDDSLAEAHTALGVVKYQADWDWAGAEKEFLRALELNTDYAPLQDWYGFFLALRGRYQEAERHCRRAVELDPLVPYYVVDLGEVFRFSRRYDEALAQYKKAIELAPDFWVAHLLKGLTLVHKREFAAAIATLESARRINPDPQVLAAIAWAQADSGHPSEARSLLAMLLEQSRQDYVSPLEIARIHVSLGKRDEAFAWLEKAYEERNSFITFLGVEPTWDPLRSDPRFADLLRRIGLAS